MKQPTFSRNKNLRVYRLPKDGEIKESYELRIQKTKPAPEGSTIHTVKEGETIDGISFKYFKTEQLWWKILDYNPFLMPLELEPGQKLIIPPFHEATRISRKRDFS